MITRNRADFTKHEVGSENRLILSTQGIRFQCPATHQRAAIPPPDLATIHWPPVIRAR